MVFDHRRWGGKKRGKGGKLEREYSKSGTSLAGRKKNPSHGAVIGPQTILKRNKTVDFS